MWSMRGVVDFEDVRRSLLHLSTQPESEATGIRDGNNSDRSEAGNGERMISEPKLSHTFEKSGF